MSSPLRIQRKRTKGWRMPPNTVVVDRTTGFGNPFPVIKGTSTHMGEIKPIFTVGTFSGPAMWIKDNEQEAAQLSVTAFREWINHPAQSSLMQRVKQLRGNNLACRCRLCDAHKNGKPFDTDCPDCAPCHADVLGKLANKGPQPG